MIYSDGSTYEGQWKEDRKNGVGVHYYVNGDCYNGEWVAGKRHGTGVYTFAATGVSYRGAWANGVQQGEGEIDLTTANVLYKGKFNKALPSGKGTFVFDHGNVQKGEFHVKVNRGANANDVDAPGVRVAEWRGQQLETAEQKKLDEDGKVPVDITTFAVKDLLESVRA